MIYLVERATGQYSDYRTNPMFYTTDKKKAEAWAKAAQDEARKLYERHEKVSSKLSAELPNDEWDKLYKRAEGMKSKMDKKISASEAYDARYYVVTVKELK